MSALLNRLAEQLAGTAENIVVMDALDSTHAFAIRLLEQMDAESVPLPVTVVVARRQTEGVGRNGRGWRSPEGGLYLNWMVTHLHASVIRALPMLAAAAAHAAVTTLGVTGAAIKWPNDVLVDGRKLAGILVHAHHGQPTWATVGLGVNLSVTPPLGEAEVRQAVSVADLLGPAGWNERSAAVVTSFVRSLVHSLEEPGPALAAWKTHLVHRPGEAIQVRTTDGASLVGTFAGVTEEGFLRLGTSDGERIVSAGDVMEGD